MHVHACRCMNECEHEHLNKPLSSDDAWVLETVLKEHTCIYHREANKLTGWRGGVERSEQRSEGGV